jgi:sugar lactone lactonase YvrE
MNLTKSRNRKACLRLGLCGVLLAAMSLPVLAQKTPGYKVDATWPKLPLPNKWTFGGVTGLAVDSEDVVWIAHRPEVDNTENYATFDPPRGSCCVPSESIMAFDAAGNLRHAWSDPNVMGEQHMLLVDQKGQVWVGSDTFRIYTKEGKLLATMPRAPRPTRTVRAGGGAQEGNQGSSGRGAGGQGGRLRGQETPFPASIELIAGAVEGADFDEPAREVYLTDSYLGGRILVFDMDTLKFKRGWGAYGKPLGEISLEQRQPLVDPSKTVNAPNKDFVSHLTIAVSKDGIVYAADRRANRIQTFTKQGKFLKEYFVAPETLDRGSSGGMAFSADPEQRYLFVGDIMNNVIWELTRADMKILGSFGYAGRNAGGFHWLHMIATDSKGNIYTGEVDTGRRIQKFVLQP